MSLLERRLIQRGLLVTPREQVGRDLGEILARYFHLKLSRWGREAVEEGEVESANSTHMAQLAAVLALPALPWPILPIDARSRANLDRGINLFTPEGRGSNVKAWFDLMDMQFTTAMTSPLQLARAEAMAQAVARVRANPLGMTIAVRIDPEDKLRSRGEAVRGEDRAEVPRASDTSLSRLVITPLLHGPPTTPGGVTAQALAVLGSRPLEAVGLARFVVWEANTEQAPSRLPVDVAAHPAARTVVAREMLARLEDDVAGYAGVLAGNQVPRLAHLTHRDLEGLKAGGGDLGTTLAPALASLGGLQQALLALREKDRAYADWAMEAAIREANGGAAGAGAEKEAFWIRRFAGLRTSIDMILLTQCLMSSAAQEDLRAVNPFGTDVPAALNLVALALLHVNRVAHAGRALMAASELRKSLEQLISQSGSGGQALVVGVQRVSQAAEGLAEALTSGRYYGTLGPDSLTVDPRFLVFESVFDLTLRSRQVSQ